MSDDVTKITSVLEDFGLTGARFAPLGNGLINKTFLVNAGDGTRYVLQQLNDVFPAEINNDIDALTRHLAGKGMLTPRVVPTRAGGLWSVHDNRVWRLLTFIEGASFDALTSSGQAREAGRLLARFHRAVDDLDIRFSNKRLGVHDTARHLNTLKSALTASAEHPRYDEIAPLAHDILAQAADLPALATSADRIVHGDPKINNILFSHNDQALCLVDLDTLTHMPLPLELGDAFRSWCNPFSEDQSAGEFSAELFRSAVEGYGAEISGWITTTEWQDIIPATQTILVELAARFCADALNESYFGWDSSRFASRSEHNQVRAQGQLTVAHSLRDQETALSAIVNSVFAGE
jgi:Ser/Thr protein kinase RdoA (MazF antagonist)